VSISLANKDESCRRAFAEWVAAANGMVGKAILPHIDETPQSRIADIFDRTDEERNLCGQAVILKDGRRGQIVTVAMSRNPSYDSRAAYFRQHGQKLSKGISECVMLSLPAAFGALKRAQDRGKVDCAPLEKPESSRNTTLGLPQQIGDNESDDISPEALSRRLRSTLKWHLRDDGYASQEEGCSSNVFRRPPTKSLTRSFAKIISGGSYEVKAFVDSDKERAYMDSGSLSDTVTAQDDGYASQEEGLDSDVSQQEALSALKALYSFRGKPDSEGQYQDGLMEETRADEDTASWTWFFEVIDQATFNLLIDISRFQEVIDQEGLDYLTDIAKKRMFGNLIEQNHAIDPTTVWQLFETLQAAERQAETAIANDDSEGGRYSRIDYIPRADEEQTESIFGLSDRRGNSTALSVPHGHSRRFDHRSPRNRRRISAVDFFDADPLEMASEGGRVRGDGHALDVKCVSVITSLCSQDNIETVEGFQFSGGAAVRADAVMADMA
jgi:hypothetical protein